jgi:hypothetical protein
MADETGVTNGFSTPLQIRPFDVRSVTGYVQRQLSTASKEMGERTYAVVRGHADADLVAGRYAVHVHLLEDGVRGRAGREREECGGDLHDADERAASDVSIFRLPDRPFISPTVVMRVPEPGTAPGRGRERGSRGSSWRTIVAERPDMGGKKAMARKAREKDGQADRARFRRGSSGHSSTTLSGYHYHDI